MLALKSPSFCRSKIGVKTLYVVKMSEMTGSECTLGSWIENQLGSLKQENTVGSMEGIEITIFLSFEENSENSLLNEKVWNA